MKNDNEKNIKRYKSKKNLKKFLIFICHFYFFIFSF